MLILIAQIYNQVMRLTNNLFCVSQNYSSDIMLLHTILVMSSKKVASSEYGPYSDKTLKRKPPAEIVQSSSDLKPELKVLASLPSMEQFSKMTDSERLTELLKPLEDQQIIESFKTVFTNGEILNELNSMINTEELQTIFNQHNVHLPPN